MKHLRIIGLCLLAVFALGAVVATAAQAEGPEWGRCVKLAKNKGKYKDANCTELEGKSNHKGEFKAKAKGAYEWEGNANTTCYEEPAHKGKYKNNTCTELEGKTNGKGEFKPKEKGHYEKVVGGTKFTGVAGAALLHSIIVECYSHNEESLLLAPRADCVGNEHNGYTTDSQPKIECKSQLATGEAAGTDEILNVSVRFKGCTLGGNPATSKGLPAGEIQVNPLKGRLGYINKTNHEVGVLLEPVTAGTPFAEFEALGLGVVVGAGNATTGSFYEAFSDTTPGTPNGNDGVISPITPVNQMTHTLTQNYRISETVVTCEHLSAENCRNAGEEFKEFQNVPSHFEGGPLEVLESYLTFGEFGDWSPAAQEETNVNTLEGEDEIKA